MGKISSEENFINLIRQYQNLVFSICVKMTGDYFAAEDLTQDTFVAAFQHLEEFDGQSAKAWLCRIAANRCIDYQRQAARRAVPFPEEEMPKPGGPNASWKSGRNQEESRQNEPLQQMLNQEILRELKRCCDILPPLYREEARAYFIEGKTAKEIAEKTGTGLKTVQTRIYRAREMMKKSYRKEMLENE